MRHRWKIVAGIWFAGAFLAGAAGFIKEDSSVWKSMNRVYAAPQASEKPSSEPDSSISYDSSTQSQLDAAQQKQEEMKKEKEQLENKLDSIQDSVSDVAKYVRTLDLQMTNLLDKIDTNKKQIKEVQQEIEEVNEEYNTALEKQQEQYEGMKAHIKYMYENSDSNYLVYLMESRSLADFLSREEYVPKVTDYDKVLLTRYQQVLDEVTVAQQRAEEKKKQVTAAKNSLKYEKQKLDQLSDEKTREIEVYQGIVKENQQNVADYAAQIAAQEKEIEDILQQGRSNIAQQEQAGESVQVMPTTGEYA